MEPLIKCSYAFSRFIQGVGVAVEVGVGGTGVGVGVAVNAAVGVGVKSSIWFSDVFWHPLQQNIPRITNKLNHDLLM